MGRPAVSPAELGLANTPWLARYSTPRSIAVETSVSKGVIAQSFDVATTETAMSKQAKDTYRTTRMSNSWCCGNAPLAVQTARTRAELSKMRANRTGLFTL